MSVWVVGVRGKGLEPGKEARVTYPHSHDVSVIYFQGRPVPTIGRAGSRHFGTVRRIEDFSSVGLVACEVQVLGQTDDRSRILREHNRPS